MASLTAGTELMMCPSAVSFTCFTTFTCTGFHVNISPMQSLNYSVLWQIDKSMWKQGSGRKVEIDTSRLLEQFAIKELGTFKTHDASNSQNIMLNEKIAHNFSK